MPVLPWPEDPPTLTDGVVTLRPWSAGDVDGVLAACQDAGVQRWTRVPSPYRREDAVAFVGSFAPQEWRSQRGVHLAVTSTADAALLGSCGLVAVDPVDLVAEVGYWVVAPARGRGLAVRAARLLAAWALSAGGLGRLEIRLEPENVASRRVAERLGFRLEGVLRGRLLLRGTRRDVAVYGLLAEDLTSQA